MIELVENIVLGDIEVTIFCFDGEYNVHAAVDGGYAIEWGEDKDATILRAVNKLR